MPDPSKTSIRPPGRVALAAAGLILLAGWASLTTSAQAQTTGCPGAPGASTIYAFADLPTRRGDIVPSIHRSLSILGTIAKRNNCTITVTCVAEGSGKNAVRNRDRQCTAARGAVLAYETRTAVRGRLAREIELVKLSGAEGGFRPGSVYVTLTAN
jgi:hypothetical protein